MKQWEDIVKDKLEGYESTLPEGSLAEFHARREATGSSARRYPWVWAAAVAVAAALAAFFFLRQPAVPVQEGIRVIQQPSTPIAVVTDTADVPEPVLIPEQFVAQALPSRKEAASSMKMEEPVVEREEIVFLQQEEESTDGMPAVEEEEVSPEKPHASSPFIIPANPVAGKKLRWKVAPSAGIVAGSGLLAALVTPIAREGYYYSSNGIQNNASSGPVIPVGQHSVASGMDSVETPGDSWENLPDPPSPGENIGGGEEEPAVQPVDMLGGPYSYYLPIKTALSARIPLTEKLNLTSGLEYSLYLSKFTFTLSGEHTQYAHYLGIPVRLDWTLASNKWLEVYAGGGCEVDFCVGAAIEGVKLERDTPAFSLVGAGGLQLNLSRNIGLYVEPELSWTAPSQGRVLSTYRKEHPFLFSLVGGLRYSFGK